MTNILRTALLFLGCVAGLMAATAPTLTTVSVLTSGGGGALGNEDSAIIISYALLANSADEADVDGGTINFRIEGINIGTLTIRSAGTTTAGTPITGGVTILDATHELVWTPSANAATDLPAFTIKAWDGALASASAVQVTVRVAAVNDAPTLTIIATITAGGGAPLGDEDTSITITGPAIFAAANEGDIDGSVSAFRIASIGTGSLAIRPLGSPGAPTPAVVGDLVSATTELVWTPPLNANGALIACTVVAFDGAADSTPAVAMPVLVNPVVDTLWILIRDRSDPVLPIVVGVPLTYTVADMVALSLCPDADGDAQARVSFDPAVMPTAGWKYEHLSASDVVLDERLASSSSPHGFFLKRDEKLRVTVTSDVPTGTNILLASVEFWHATEEPGKNTNPYYFEYRVTVGGSAGGGSAGGGGGGCGLGGAVAGLIALLGLALRGRKWHA